MFSCVVNSYYCGRNSLRFSFFPTEIHNLSLTSTQIRSDSVRNKIDKAVTHDTADHQLTLINVELHSILCAKAVVAVLSRMKSLDADAFNVLN